MGLDETPEGPGRCILTNIVACGFKGAVFPISETAKDVEGMAAYPNLAAVNRKIDLAVLALPLEQIPSAIDACGRSGVTGAIVTARDVCRPELLSAIREKARATGVRVIGPRSWGLISSWGGLHSGLLGSMPPTGGLAVISQSASVCAGILDLSIAKRIGLSLLVGVGEMADVDCADLLDYTANHHRVQSILLHVEKIDDMRKFMSAARAASRLKPIVILKTDRSAVDAPPSFTAAGRLIREDAVYDAAFRRAGMVRVSTMEELFDCGDLLSKQPHPQGPGLAVITNARTPGIMTKDALREYGLTVAHPGEEMIGKLDSLLGACWSRQNPIAVRSDIPPDHYGRIVEICLAAGEADAVLVVIAPRFLSAPDAVARAVVGAVRRKTKPVFAVWMGDMTPESGARILDGAGIPTYDVPERAVRAFFHLYTYERNIRLLQEIPPQLSGRLAVNRARARSIIDSEFKKQNRTLDGEASLRLLKAYDIPAASQESIRTCDAKLRLAVRQVPSLGPAVLFGMGGPHPELCLDIEVGVPPLNRLLARRLMEATRIYRFLEAEFPAAAGLLEDLLVNFSYLITDFPEIAELEVDPLVVSGRRVFACNARASIRTAPVRAPLHLIISTYPDEYETTTVTGSGIELFIRPIKPEDARLLQELWSILSPQTIYYRFSRPVPELTPDLLVRFTQIDYDREIALVALNPIESGHRMLGVSRLMSAPGSDLAEFAIVVGDPWQGKGVGAKLLSRIAVIARQRGFKTLWGLVLRENIAMIELARKLGWPVVTGDDASQVEVSLDLTAVSESEILAASGESMSESRGDRSP
jgi:acetyltransferase